jgi:ubiquinone/menaquinone biosynthesis C-methylase UbiE
LYGDAQVVSYYRDLSGLQAVEHYVFEKYVALGSSVIDIGVGGGRTTLWLSSRGGRYLGIDYSQAMVDACQEKFPGLEFKLGDATCLSDVGDAAFDAAIFSFNGIDYIGTDAGRVQCLKEMKRVVAPGGVVIFSSHNAKNLGIYPRLNGADPLRKVWRVARTALRSPPIAVRALLSKAFHEGAGYVLDPVHGGLYTHVSTPASIARDARLAGLSVVETVGGYHPARVSKYLTNWYYYALRAADLSGGSV